jgi:hypothetical protein
MAEDIARRRDPPPGLAPHEKPTPEELARIARELLEERAKDDAQLAEKIRQRGIPLNGR